MDNTDPPVGLEKTVLVFPKEKKINVIRDAENRMKSRETENKILFGLVLSVLLEGGAETLLETVVEKFHHSSIFSRAAEKKETRMPAIGVPQPCYITQYGTGRFLPSTSSAVGKFPVNGRWLKQGPQPGVFIEEEDGALCNGVQKRMIGRYTTVQMTRDRVDPPQYRDVAPVHGAAHRRPVSFIRLIIGLALLALVGAAGVLLAQRPTARFRLVKEDTFTVRRKMPNNFSYFVEPACAAAGEQKCGVEECSVVQSHLEFDVKRCFLKKVTHCKESVWLTEAKSKCGSHFHASTFFVYWHPV